MMRDIFTTNRTSGVCLCAKRYSRQNIIKPVRFSDEKTSRMLRCDWSTCLLTIWTSSGLTIMWQS